MWVYRLRKDVIFMSDLKIFNNEEFGEVRTVVVEDKIYFCGKDVASALGYKDTVKALKTIARGL